MAPRPIWIADPTAGRAVRLTIIGVVDRRAFNTYGIITAARTVAGAGFPRVPPTLSYFKAAPGVNPCSCPGDVTHNGVVDIDDLLAVIGAWGPCAGCAADCTHNCVVDIDDLLAVITDWG